MIGSRSQGSQSLPPLQGSRVLLVRQKLGLLAGSWQLDCSFLDPCDTPKAFPLGALWRCLQLPLQTKPEGEEGLRLLQAAGRGQRRGVRAGPSCAVILPRVSASASEHRSLCVPEPAPPVSSSPSPEVFRMQSSWSSPQTCRRGPRIPFFVSLSSHAFWVMQTLAESHAATLLGFGGCVFKLIDIHSHHGDSSWFPHVAPE